MTHRGPWKVGLPQGVPVAQDDCLDSNLPLSEEGPFLLNDTGRGEDALDEAASARAAGLHIARWWLSARKLREEMFGAEHFSDPAWDILLDLYTSEARGENVQISSLAFAARVPHSTAIRWARIMTQAGLMVRERDPSDARRVHVRLSPKAVALMEEYLEKLTSGGQAPMLLPRKPI